VTRRSSNFPRELLGAGTPDGCRGASAWVGTVDDAYGNAPAESVYGLVKIELIKPRGPWRIAEQVEIATLEYVDWVNHRQVCESCGDIPPSTVRTPP
jgi:putative transposase